MGAEDYKVDHRQLEHCPAYIDTNPRYIPCKCLLHWKKQERLTARPAPFEEYIPGKDQCESLAKDDTKMPIAMKIIPTEPLPELGAELASSEYHPANFKLKALHEIMDGEYLMTKKLQFQLIASYLAHDISLTAELRVSERFLTELGKRHITKQSLGDIPLVVHLSDCPSPYESEKCQSFILNQVERRHTLPVVVLGAKHDVLLGPLIEILSPAEKAISVVNHASHKLPDDYYPHLFEQEYGTVWVTMDDRWDSPILTAVTPMRTETNLNVFDQAQLTRRIDTLPESRRHYFSISSYDHISRSQLILQLPRDTQEKLSDFIGKKVNLPSENPLELFTAIIHPDNEKIGLLRNRLNQIDFHSLIYSTPLPNVQNQSCTTVYHWGERMFQCLQSRTYHMNRLLEHASVQEIEELCTYAQGGSGFTLSAEEACFWYHYKGNPRELLLVNANEMIQKISISSITKSPMSPQKPFRYQLPNPTCDLFFYPIYKLWNRLEHVYLPGSNAITESLRGFPEGYDYEEILLNIALFNRNECTSGLSTFNALFLYSFCERIQKSGTRSMHIDEIWVTQVPSRLIPHFHQECWRFFDNQPIVTMSSNQRLASVPHIQCELTEEAYRNSDFISTFSNGTSYWDMIGEATINLMEEQRVLLTVKNCIESKKCVSLGEDGLPSFWGLFVRAKENHIVQCLGEYRDLWLLTPESEALTWFNPRLQESYLSRIIGYGLLDERMSIGVDLLHRLSNSLRKEDLFRYNTAISSSGSVLERALFETLFLAAPLFSSRTKFHWFHLYDFVGDYMLLAQSTDPHFADLDAEFAKVVPFREIPSILRLYATDIAHRGLYKLSILPVSYLQKLRDPGVALDENDLCFMLAAARDEEHQNRYLHAFVPNADKRTKLKKKCQHTDASLNFKSLLELQKIRKDNQNQNQATQPNQSTQPEHANQSTHK